jgi:hypothetical protein
VDVAAGLPELRNTRAFRHLRCVPKGDIAGLGLSAEAALSLSQYSRAAVTRIIVHDQYSCDIARDELEIVFQGSSTILQYPWIRTARF